MSEITDLEDLELNFSPDWDGKPRKRKAPFGWKKGTVRGRTWTRAGRVDPNRADSKLKKF